MDIHILQREACCPKYNGLTLLVNHTTQLLPHFAVQYIASLVHETTLTSKLIQNMVAGVNTTK